MVEFAFGADPSDPTAWQWTDVTPDFFDQTIQITRGRQDEMDQVQPSEVTLVLDNRHGHYTPDQPLSPYWPHVVVGTPMRITVAGSVRFVGHVASWEPAWPYGDLSDLDDIAELGDEQARRGEATVTVTAAGVLRRLEQGGALDSALRRFYLSLGDFVRAYVPLEDGETASQAGSLVPGASGIRFAVPPAFGRDTSIPGSAAGPEWPVLVYFGSMASTGTVLPPTFIDWAWQVHVTYRIPAGTTDVWLCEWIATGTYTRWALRIDSGGQLMVQATTADDPPTTITRTAPGAVNDGLPRSAVVQVHDLGLGIVGIAVNGETLTQASGTVGPVTRIRPQPMHDTTPPDGQEPISLVHMVVIEDPLDFGQWVPPPALGFAGESATGRVVRLAEEALVPIRVRMPMALADDFDRTVPGGWGGDWVTLGTVGAAQLDVDAGTATISGSDVGDIALVGLPDVTGADVDVLVRFEFAAGQPDQFTILARFDGAATAYSFGVDGFAAYIQVATGDGTHWLGGAPLDIPVGVPHWMQAQAVGGVMRLRAWPDGDTPPPVWTVVALNLELASGMVGVAAVFGGPATVAVTHVEVRSAVSQALGPQPQSTLVDALRECEQADMGILHETRDEPGLTWVPRDYLHNQPPTVVLDAAGGGQGDITNPFLPVLDDQAIRNDVTVSRVGGSEARAVDAASTPRHGVYVESAQVNIAGDEQLPDQAGWRLWLGTQTRMRYPAVSPALNARAEIIPAWQAVDIADRVDVINLPPQHPTDAVSQIVQGGVETYSPTTMDADATLSPARPYQVAVWDAVRYATDPGGSVLTADADLTDAGPVVLQVAGQEWTTDPADWDDPQAGPLDLLVAGVRVRVTHISAPASGVQQITVTRVNDMPKTAPAGSEVTLADERPWAL